MESIKSAYHHLNIKNLLKLLAVPLIYWLLHEYPRLEGALIGALITWIALDVQKYGLLRSFFRPENRLVTKIFDHIWSGELDHVKKIAEGMPQEYLHAMTQQGYSTLMWAVHHRRRDIVQYLLQKGAPVNQQRKNGETAMQRAIYINDRAIIKDLIDAGADLDNCSFPARINACLYSILRDKPKTMDLLLEGGASLDYFIKKTTLPDEVRLQYPQRYEINQRTTIDCLSKCSPEYDQIHAKHILWRKKRNIFDAHDKGELPAWTKELNHNVLRTVLQDYV